MKEALTLTLSRNRERGSERSAAAFHPLFWNRERGSERSAAPFRPPLPVAGAGGGEGKQRGFSLVAALFLIVVLALLGLFAVRITGGQQQTVNLALLSARALSAANAGIEWGAYQALKNTTCANSTLNLNEAALNGFTVTVQCTQTTLSEQGAPVTLYDLTASARYGTYGQPDFVQRTVRARFSSAP